MELLSFMLGLGRGAMDGQRDVSPAPVVMRTRNMMLQTIDNREDYRYLGL